MFYIKMKTIRRGHVSDFGDIYGKILKIRHRGGGGLTAGHKVSGNMFERRKYFEAKCGGKDHH